jgi:hypothetical protein
MISPTPHTPHNLSSLIPCGCSERVNNYDSGDMSCAAYYDPSSPHRTILQLTIADYPLQLQPLTSDEMLDLIAVMQSAIHCRRRQLEGDGGMC